MRALVDEGTHELETTPSMVLSPGPILGELAVDVGGASDRGRVREENEDVYLVAEFESGMRVRDSNLPSPTASSGEARGPEYLLVVADGMGGQASGATASALAVRTFIESLSSRGASDRPKESLVESIRAADRAVVEASRDDPGREGMGTTLTAASLSGGGLSVAHVGDSRCLLWRDRRLRRLTRDHTVAQELVDEGNVDSIDTVDEKLRNALTEAIGGGKPGVRPEVVEGLLRVGDTVLLCTDGLTKELPADEIGEVLALGRSAGETCRMLVEAALDAGGRDNVTVVVARIGAAGE